MNWTLATDIARRTSAQEPDPSPDRNDQTKVADAMRLADHWLDEATVLPSGVTTTAAWSRAEWIEQTTEVWRVLVEPVAEHVVGAMGKAMPEEAKAMAGPLIGMIGKAGGAMFGSQVGAALGGLAGEVLTASDIGLPLGPAGKAALVPHNIAEFAEGLDVSDDDVLLYLSLREAAHQRLFAHVPWLRQHLISSVEDFGRGVTIDISGIEQAMGQIDPTNMEAIQEALQGGLFEPQQTPEQKSALVRLETTLALVEGWVDEVVGQATAERMPAAGQDAGGHPSPPSRRRSGRGDLRRPRRPRAAAPPAARRLGAVGLAPLPPGQGGPRRRLGPPRPAAHRRRPRRPAGLPRGPARGRRAERRGVRQGHRPAARPRVEPSPRTARTATADEPDEPRA